MLNQHPKQKYNLSEYHKILCPESDYPEFIKKYLEVPALKRLGGVGLLCGTDWTPLYKNRLYYSRLDHSVGVALIVWHFTHDKAQTIAGLLHDISTTVFSHVSDFRKGDALTQTFTEGPTASIIRGDSQLQALLAADGLTNEQVEDYHIYPVADNEIPQLSADRLEYMFPSGMALDGSWTMEEIKRCYNDIEILTNEDGKPELGFKTVEIAEEYCRHFCMIGHILQLNENKLTLHLLGQIMNLAVEKKALSEKDFMELSESAVIKKLEDYCSGNHNKTSTLSKLYRTFRTMTEVRHVQNPLPDDSFFNVHLKVKQRYINPLVKISDSEGTKVKRLSEVSSFASTLIQDFLSFEDSPFGCVAMAD